MGSPIINPFAGAANLGFELSTFGPAFSILPNLYNRVGSMFSDRPITTTTATIERLNGTLNIVSSIPRGASAPKVTADKRDMRAVMVPHLAVQDIVTPGEVQDVRAFGSGAAESNAAVLKSKSAKMRRILDQTAEFLACGALKGIVYDADGSVLLNLYDAFNVTQTTVDFVLDSDTTVVIKKVLEVKRDIENNLKGESMSGIRCLCSSTFYDALTTHPEVEKAFAAYMALNQNLADDYRRGFRFGGIVFEEYMGTWTDADGNARPALTANYGICFPEGTSETFVRFVAPGDFMDTANTAGQPYYAKMEPKKFNQGYELWAESNILPLCLRPDLLVTVSI